MQSRRECKGKSSFMFNRFLVARNKQRKSLASLDDLYPYTYINKIHDFDSCSTSSTELSSSLSSSNPS